MGRRRRGVAPSSCVCEPMHGLARREREPQARERAHQGRQRARAARIDPARLALPDVSEAKRLAQWYRARTAGATATHRKSLIAGAQAADHAVAPRHDRRGAARRGAAAGHLRETPTPPEISLSTPWPFLGAVDDRSEAAAIRARPWLQMPRTEWTGRLGALLAKRIPASWSGSLQIQPNTSVVRAWLRDHRRLPSDRTSSPIRAALARSLPACRRARGGQGAVIPQTWSQNLHLKPDT
jgi:hypothetical protein